jgi:hypothetical protein
LFAAMTMKSSMTIRSKRSIWIATNY